MVSAFSEQSVGISSTGFHERIVLVYLIDTPTITAAAASKAPDCGDLDDCHRVMLSGAYSMVIIFGLHKCSSDQFAATRCPMQYCTLEALQLAVKCGLPVLHAEPAGLCTRSCKRGYRG